MECDSILYIIFSFIGVHCQYNSLPQLKFIYMAFFVVVVTAIIKVVFQQFCY